MHKLVQQNVSYAKNLLWGMRGKEGVTRFLLQWGQNISGPPLSVHGFLVWAKRTVTAFFCTFTAWNRTSRVKKLGETKNASSTPDVQGRQGW